MAGALAELGSKIKGLIVPGESAGEAALVRDLCVLGAASLQQVAGHISGEFELEQAWPKSGLRLDPPAALISVISRVKPQ